MSENTQGGVGIPPRPREITPRAARRSWAELPVRFWWLAGVAIVALGLFILGERTINGLRERQLVREGRQVTARIISIDKITRRGYAPPRYDSHKVVLAVELEKGKPLQVEGTLPAGEGTIAVGGTLEISIDPKDPARWTDRQPPSWSMDLIIPALLLPLGAILLLVALLKRKQVLAVWRGGEVLKARVVELRQSAMAPLSRVIRYTLEVGEDARVFSTLAPATGDLPAVGEVIEVVALPSAPERGIVARLYI